MEQAEKAMILGELSVVKSLISSVNSQIGGLSMNSFPVTGNMIMIPALPMAHPAAGWRLNGVFRCS